MKLEEKVSFCRKYFILIYFDASVQLCNIICCSIVIAQTDLNETSSFHWI